MNHTQLKLEKRNALRPGLTLLEVLISTFVLSIGLLGLLSLIPVGGYRVGQVNQFDRAATTGRHAFREFKTRDMLEPNKWMAWEWTDNTTSQYMRTWENPEGPGVDVDDRSLRNVDDWAETFLIDPLFVARGTSFHDDDWPGRTFPYELKPSSALALRTGVSKTANYLNVPRMPRVTLSMLEDFSALNVATPPPSPSPPTAYSMVNSVAERIFMSQNDGIFDLPTDEAETPVRLFSGGDADIEQYQGDYTWMAMVSRSPQEVLPVDVGGMYYDISPSIRNEYKVSIIVFAKRNFDTDVVSGVGYPAEALASERICGIEFLNGLGLGGGDVAISAGPVDSVSAAEAEEYLDVSPNQWIMVCSWTPRQQNNPTPSSTVYLDVYGQARLARPVYRWYRVVATDKGPETVDVGGTDHWVRYLTLDGPDWDPTASCNINGAPIAPADIANNLTDTYAVLVDGVVAVFERTIRREE